MLRIAGRAVRIPKNIPWQKIPVKPSPVMTISSKLEDKNTIYTANLKFLTCQELDEQARYCYLVTTISGEEYLIGSNERPYPVMTTSENMPESVKDNQLYEINVTYSSPQSIAYVIG